MPSMKARVIVVAVLGVLLLGGVTAGIVTTRSSSTPETSPSDAEVQQLQALRAAFCPEGEIQSDRGFNSNEGFQQLACNYGDGSGDWTWFLLLFEDDAAQQTWQARVTCDNTGAAVIGSGWAAYHVPRPSIVSDLVRQGGQIACSG